MVQLLNRHSLKAPSKLRERLRETTRRAILEAAEDVYSRCGVAGGRIEEVAEGAGVSVGTVYNYFADRQALVTSLLETRRAELLERVDTALAAVPDDFEPRLHVFLEAVLEHFVRHRKFFAILVQGELDRRGPELLAAGGTSETLQELTRRARAIVECGLSLGRLRREESGFLAHVLVGAVRSVLLQSLVAGEEVEPDRLCGRLERMFLRGAGG